MRREAEEFLAEVCGDDLMTVDVADTIDAQALADQLRASGNWLEVTAGISSVAVQFDASAQDCDAALEQLQQAMSEGIVRPENHGELIEIPVHYGGEHGPDFDAVCERQGLTAEELIALHTGGEYRVELVGFTPGFAFIGGLDPKLNVPRHTAPRQRVNAGSVGIADGRTGLYALAVPGGWQIIGSTNLSLFDPAADPPNRLHAGTRVRFVDITEQS